MRDDVSSLIRRGDGRDAQPVAVVHVQAWQAAYRGLLPDQYLDELSVAERSTLWQKLLNDGVRMLVAEQVGTAGLAGFASCGPSRDDGARGRCGELYALYTHPSVWGSGIGRALHDAAVADLVDQQFLDATLWVLDGNQRALRFYERHGWQPDGGVRVEQLPGARLLERRYTRPLINTGPGSR